MVFPEPPWLWLFPPAPGEVVPELPPCELKLVPELLAVSLVVEHPNKHKGNDNMNKWKSFTGCSFVGVPMWFKAACMPRSNSLDLLTFMA
jgi:hypothetical protein